MSAECNHERCQSNGHCILDALWMNPPEFDKPALIEAAATMQEEYWRQRRDWDAKESAVVSALWLLVDAAQDAAPGPVATPTLSGASAEGNDAELGAA